MAETEIIEIFRDTAFDRDTINRLCAAYDHASKALHDRGRPQVVNEIIAKRIIAMAEKGERNPITLADDALKELGFKDETR
jgi:hypothetical protein